MNDTLIVKLSESEFENSKKDKTELIQTFIGDIELAGDFLIELLPSLYCRDIERRY